MTSAERQQMFDDLDEVLECLNANRIRATYRAVAVVIRFNSARGMGRVLVVRHVIICG